MTTIAIHRADPDEGGQFTIAADRRVLVGDTIAEPQCKIYRLKSGDVLTGSGGQVQLARMQRWFDAGHAVRDADDPGAPKMGNDDGSAVHIARDGTVTIFADGGHDTMLDLWRCFGSGGVAARAILLRQDGARQAVAIASRLDPYSGDGIDVVNLVDGHFYGECLKPIEPMATIVEKFGDFTHTTKVPIADLHPKKVVDPTQAVDPEEHRAAVVAGLVIAANPYQADLARKSPEHNLELILVKVAEAVGRDPASIEAIVSRVLKEGK